MSRSEEQIFLKALCATGTVVIGHILFSNGEHGHVGINPRVLYPHTTETSFLCKGIAERFRYDKVETVISLAAGGNAALSQWVAHHLGEMCKHEVYAVYAEEEAPPTGIFGVLSSGRGKLTTNLNHRSFVTGKNILVVGDFLTNGKEAKKLVEAVREVGGKVVGIGVLSNCAKVLPKDLAKIPKLVALTSLELNRWREDKCPLCKRDKQEVDRRNKALSAMRK